MDVIEVTGLRKAYGNVVAVRDLDLRVRAGEMVCVLGPNGAGKTTTVETLLGLRTPTAGTVRVLGGSPASAAVRERVGVMLQDTDAPESLTVTETVDLVASYYPYRLPTAEVLSRADLRRQAGLRVSQLSGGLRQRLSFALAVVGDPDLLFLDEPTASLDVEARRAFWQQVTEFSELGKTIVFCTHNLVEAEEFAQRIVVFHTGQVVEDGTPDQIRRLVSGRTVELVTDLSDDEIGALDGVRGFAAQGSRAAAGRRRVRMQVAQPEPVLRALFTTGRLVEDLTVGRSSLEEAFMHITSREAAT